MPFFKQYPITRGEFFQFLTISPPNYISLDEGQEHLRKSFAKFIRRQYLKGRIKAGFYVIEAKQGNDGSWNIHLHAIIYGRWLDYRLRGQCLECGQNLIKFNKTTKKFYCANHKCKSENIVRFDDTRLGREWAESAGSSAHIYGERVRYAHGAVSYLTKYIALNKDNFLSVDDAAEYTIKMRKRKLINSFGQFYHDIRKGKMPMPIHHCKHCGEEISYFFDIEVSCIIKIAREKPPDPQQILNTF